MFRYIIAMLVFALIPTTTWAAKTVQVRGYYRKDGTYVQPYTRSAPGSGGSYVAPVFVPPPVAPRTAYRASASTRPRTAARTTYRSSTNDEATPSSTDPKGSTPRIIPIAKQHPFRIWRDSSGQFQVMAKFRSYANGVVRIEREDGTIIDIPMERLSFGDQQYVNGL